MCAMRTNEDLVVRHPPLQTRPEAESINGGSAIRTIVNKQQIDELDEPRRVGLLLLLRGHEFAEALHCSDWDFALEISALSRLGLSRMDLRWLVLKGYLTHAKEVTRSCASGREFSPSGKLTFGPRTCFLLTPAGATLARALRDFLSGTLPATDAAGVTPEREKAARQSEFRPCWDCDRRELRVAGQIVKQFKVRSPNQETVLMAFQEEKWPSRIDDPLPGHPDMDAKQRLHDTIRSLNRNQKERLIRFKGDGKGEGVIWELTLVASPVSAARS